MDPLSEAEDLGGLEELGDLVVALAERLGDDFLNADSVVDFTAAGRPVIRQDGVVFFRDERDGAPVAARVRGGRAEFARVAEGGAMDWSYVPLSPPELN